jgi:hypothetical protein
MKKKLGAVNDDKYTLLVFERLPKVSFNNQLPELYKDTVIYYKECRVLAPKLGFKDSASLADYFKPSNVLSKKIVSNHPNMTLQPCTEAVDQLNSTYLVVNTGKGVNDIRPTSTGPCDEVIGQFIINVSGMRSIRSYTSVVGEVLAGTCMVGALSVYNTGMKNCSHAQ